MTQIPVNANAEVALIMGSQSDWEIMKKGSDLLEEFGVPHDALVVSAHRTPQWMTEFAEHAEDAGYQIIIAGAGGAAHLPGMVASHTMLPVIGVPIPSKHLQGLDSLLSIVQMPAGIPVATMAIGESGSKNAALLAIRFLAQNNSTYYKKLMNYNESLREKVESKKVLR